MIAHCRHWSIVVVFLFGCGTAAQTTGKAPGKSVPPTTAEEKAVMEFFAKSKLPQVQASQITVLKWGPHDLERKSAIGFCESVTSIKHTALIRCVFTVAHTDGVTQKYDYLVLVDEKRVLGYKVVNEYGDNWLTAKVSIDNPVPFGWFYISAHHH